ncbi:MAG: IS3 family transposase, partial [Pseudonocardiaceae bacterium]
MKPLEERKRTALQLTRPGDSRAQAPKKLAILDEVEPGWRTHFATVLGVSRSSYYSPRTKRSQVDQEAITQLLAVHEEHQYYGVRRLAWHLGWNPKKARRIRTLAGVIIPRATKKRRIVQGKSEIPAPANALKPYAVFRDENRPQDGQDYSGMVYSGAWVQDFTHLWFGRSWYYLAVVLDLRTRQIVGWRLGANHSSELTYAAVLDGLSKYEPPAILHSDQGSEYLSYKHELLCAKLDTVLSTSDKASPWQNGFMERWFGNFKLELGPLARFKYLAELHEAIALQVYYYNHKR